MRPEKELLLNEITAKIDSSPAFVLASYSKMSPNLAATFRSNIGKVGGRLKVVKKRVFLKAAEKSGFSLDRADLQGHVGVIFTPEDPVETAKYVYQFRKENKGTLEVLGGRFEGAICSAGDVELISKLPNQNEMRAQLLGLFEAPMSQTLAVVDALLTSVIYCLDNKAGESEENANV